MGTKTADYVECDANKKLLCHRNYTLQTMLIRTYAIFTNLPIIMTELV